MMLTDITLHALMDDERVSGLIDPNVQIQQSGIDLTLKKVEAFLNDGIPGVLDFDNSNRLLPRMLEIPFDEEDKVFLRPGVYRVNLDPCIPIPETAMGFAMPRSSLARMGCGIQSGFWDAGYVGDSTVVLMVFNPSGVILYRGARLAQLALVRTEGTVKSLYSGIYQGGTDIHDNGQAVEVEVEGTENLSEEGQQALEIFMKEYLAKPIGEVQIVRSSAPVNYSMNCSNGACKFELSQTNSVIETGNKIHDSLEEAMKAAEEKYYAEHPEEKNGSSE